MRRTMAIWLKLQIYIRKENDILQGHHEIIVTKFRFIKLCRKTLLALQDEAQERKITREKDLYKRQMMDKVR